jgi:hypothetical protein
MGRPDIRGQARARGQERTASVVSAIGARDVQTIGLGAPGAKERARPESLHLFPGQAEPH